MNDYKLPDEVWDNLRRFEDGDIDLDTWPNCTVPDCSNKCCLSLESKYCYPHTMDYFKLEKKFKDNSGD